MRSVVDEEVIVAVELEQIEAEHKLLQDRLSLERDGAIQVGLILRPQHGAVNLAVELLKKMRFAQGCHVICPVGSNKKTKY